tara:strand:- start:16 stop:720 length:705 start_codon:yes stop_codon:yes gene_type:complete
MKDLRHIFADIQPEDLHYLYGANCFQHALGYSGALIALEKSRDIISLNYITLFPGTNASAFYNCASLDHFNRVLSAACKDEGIENCGMNFRQCQGYRTLAIFSGLGPEGRLDYHFAFLNKNGQWEDKTPFKPSKTYADTSEIERDQGYKLQFYGLIREGKEPKCIEGLKIAKIDIGTMSNPCLTNVIVITANMPTLPVNNYTTMRGVDAMMDRFNQIYTAPKINDEILAYASEL